MVTVQYQKKSDVCYDKKLKKGDAVGLLIDQKSGREK